MMNEMFCFSLQPQRVQQSTYHKGRMRKTLTDVEVLKNHVVIYLMPLTVLDKKIVRLPFIVTISILPVNLLSLQK